MLAKLVTIPEEEDEVVHSLSQLRTKALVGKGYVLNRSFDGLSTR